MSAYRSLAAVYDRLTENVAYRQRAEYICSLFYRYGKKSGILLDAGCGTGNFSALFAEKGYEVIGVDDSEEMLMEARRKQTQTGQDILYLRQDMRALDLYGTVDCAVCLLDGLNHLPGKESLFAALRSIGFFMEKDGIFIFDVNTEYKHRVVLGNETFVYDEEEVYCVWQNQYDESEKRTDIQLDFFFPEQNVYCRESESFSEWFYDDNILREGLKQAAFDCLDCLPAPFETDESGKAQRLYYICRKVKDQ